MSSRAEAAADAFRRLFESEEEAGLAVLDAEGRIRAASAVLERLCANGPAPGPGRDPALLFAEANHDAVRQIISVALAGPPAPPAIEVRLAAPDQPADAAVEVHCRPLRGEQGALLRVLDITARRRRQAQLEEAARRRKPRWRVGRMRQPPKICARYWIVPGAVRGWCVSFWPLPAGRPCSRV